MVCYAVQYNLPQSTGGTSGLRPYCVATSVGSFIGDSKMKLIPLTQGKFAIVDDEDYERLSQWKWQVRRLTYGGFAAVRTRQSTEKDGPQSIHMSRVITKAPAGLVVDHINHDTLDNRKCNLRICTTSQNAYNRKPYGASSKYKGVSMPLNSKKWMARISIKGKQHILGTFETEESAAEAYKVAAKEFHGEYCYIEP